MTTEDTEDMEVQPFRKSTFLRVLGVLRGGAFAIAVLLYGYVGLGAVHPVQTAALSSTKPSALSPLAL